MAKSLDKALVQQPRECVVFYSWQSDLDPNVTRSFVLNALEDAAKRLRTDKSIKVVPVIDRDTQGIGGSPDIAHTIFSKIDKCQIFVCDVSLITPQNAKRPAPNPNVLVELGYALKRLGSDKIILVMNKDFGEPEKLPFDLRTKRVIQFSAIASEESQAPMEQLSGTLASSIRVILEIGFELEMTQVVEGGTAKGSGEESSHSVRNTILIVITIGLPILVTDDVVYRLFEIGHPVVTSLVKVGIAIMLAAGIWVPYLLWERFKKRHNDEAFDRDGGEPEKQ